MSVPRDRKGEFEHQVLKKNQTSIGQDIEEKILSMYAKGMTTGDIEAHIQDIYGISVSDSTVSRITDKILPIAKEWQQRPLESIYAVVFLDAIHYHVRSEGQIVKKAVYIAIGVNLDGRKDVLGMWVGENESAKFWATVLNGLKNRGVEDIFIACTDNLTGFDAAIHATFPQTMLPGFFASSCWFKTRLLARRPPHPRCGTHPPAVQCAAGCSCRLRCFWYPPCRNRIHPYPF